MNKRIIGFTAVMIAALVGGSATASTLGFNFSGHVSGVADDSSGTFGANFAAGDSVTGQFVIDTTAAPSGISLHYASYPASFSATVSGQNFGGPAEYRIFNDDPGAGDGFSIINEVGTYSAPALGDLVPRTFFIQFLGMPTTTLSDFSQVTDPVSLFPLYSPAYAPHGLRLDNSADGSFGLLYFTVDSLSAVPESGGLSLLGLGIFALICYRRVALITC